MKSIAIWYTPVKPQELNCSDLELHFNFWKIPNGSKDHHKFLDIGIKLDNTTGVKYLNIFFPTPIDSNEFVDIVSKFIDKPDLVSAIFNENYKVIADGTSKLYEIKDSHNEFIFNIYRTSNNDLSFTSFNGGTIISITIPQIHLKSYYRFRVTGPFIKSLSVISEPTNAILESAFSEIEMVDFRVNEIRDLNQDLLEKIRNEGLLTIKKSHFFFICSNDEEIIGNHQPFISCRNLETYRWNNYVDLPNSGKNVYLAYHWKEVDSDSVSILIKTKYEKNNWQTISKFLIYGFVAAVLIELFSNWLYDILKGALTFKCN